MLLSVVILVNCIKYLPTVVRMLPLHVGLIDMCNNCNQQQGDKPHVDTYKEIMNELNYDATCTITALPIFDLETCKRFVFNVP